MPDPVARMEVGLFVSPISIGSRSPEPPAEDGWKVIVVEKGTARPVPGALVFVLDGLVRGGRAGILWKFATNREDLIGIFDRFGRKFITNTKGETSIPRSVMGLLDLLAVHGNHVGFCHIRPANFAPPLKIELKPERRFSVQVVNANGEPMPGVHASLLMTAGRRRRVLCPAQAREPDGIAEFRFLDFFLGQEYLVPREARFHAALMLPLPEPVGSPLDLDDLPQDPIRLTVPPTGRVEVRVRGQDSPPSDGSVHVGIMAMGNDRIIDRQGAIRSALPLRAGKVEFPFVGLGLRLIAFVVQPIGPGMVDEASAQEGPGPLEPGQMVLFELVLGEPDPILVGRSLDATGSPIAETTLKYSCAPRGADRESQGWFVRSDGDGLFEIPFSRRPDFVRTEWDGSMEWALHLSTVGREEGDLEGEIPLPWPIPPGRTEVGDVLLSLPPLVAAGIVRDSQGRPVSGARMSIFENVEWEAGTNRFRWHPLLWYSFTTGTSGVFSMRGQVKSSAVKITAFKPGFRQVGELVAASGSRNLEISMIEPGSLAGSLLIPEGLRGRDIQVNLEYLSSESGHVPERFLATHVESDGRFQWLALLPGVVRVFVDWRRDQRLFTVDNVTIRSGVVARDPRLQDVDLRRFLKLIDIAFETGSGSAFPAHLRVYLLPEMRAIEPALVRGRLATFVVPSLSADLLIETRDFQPVYLNDVLGETKLVLQEKPRVRLLLSRDLPLPEPPLQIMVRMNRIEEEQAALPDCLRDRIGSECLGAFDACGQAVLLVPTPGTYRISWSVGGAGRTQWKPLSSSIAPVEVRESDSEQAIHIGIPFQELMDAVGEARSR